MTPKHCILSVVSILLGNFVLKVCSNILPQFLPEDAEGLGIVFVHILPNVLVIPDLIDQVLNFNQDPQVKPRGDPIFLLVIKENFRLKTGQLNSSFIKRESYLCYHWLCLLVGFGELRKTRLHLIEVIDLLAIPNGFDDGGKGFVSLLLGRLDDSFSIFFIVTELQETITS